jgi:hypothetical protein
MSYGDHIWVRRVGYSHHGIDCGDGTVIHFSGEPGSKRAAAVVRSSIEDFSKGHVIRTVSYGERRSPVATVAAAEEALGQAGYNLVWNNCEHFARWCCTGSKVSDQVRGVTAGTAVTAAVPTAAAVGVATVSGAGAAAGLSGAGVMSGLGAAGGLIGGGAALGPVVLAAGPAAAGAGIVHLALRDDPMHDETERKSRRDGRRASKAAAAATAVAAPAAISAAGTTAGLSAAGISSGLAAIGGVAGGGMAAGVGVLVAAPVVAAGAAGAGLYFGGKAVRRRRERKRALAA